MSPLHRITEEEPNRHGKILNDYVEIIKIVTRKYSIPLLDMMQEGGLSPRVPVQQELYMPDGLHPNDAGQGRISTRLKGFLLSL